MIRKTAKGFLSLSVIVYFLFLTLFGLSDYLYPDNILRAEGERAEEMLCFSFSDSDANGKEKVMAFGFLPLKNVSVRYFSESEVLLGGEIFGVRLQTDGLLVTELDEVQTSDGVKRPAVEAGLKKGDVIRMADGVNIQSAADFSKILSKSGGKEIVLTVLRGKEEKTLSLQAAKATDDSYKGGLWVRDGVAGLGTVTFTDPKTNLFAGLGHGVCDSETGTLFPLGKGEVCHATVEKIICGKPSAPGEIKGLLGETEGALCANTISGVYGKKDADSSATLIKTAAKNEVKCGKAVIYCTLDETGKKEYEIEIEEIIGADRQSKNFIIRVTDEELLKKTGGIVQGMSGSPIVQEGKLIGAVTHVLVNDPTRGYGIFIENMMKTAASVADGAAENAA